MANEIGFSTIYPGSGLGSAGPIGATGATGANQTVRGSTGATGLDSNYITSVVVNQDTGVVEFGLSDGTNVSPGTLIGATGVYAGVTAFSLGSGISLLKGVCGGITLDFYNFRTDGLLGITYSTDGALVFTISANSGAGGISPSIENDRIVYAQSKTTIMSTDLIPQASNSANRIEAGGLNYGYINFGGETAGRNIVADITESSLSVGPIERGGFDVTLSDFYVNGVEGITLDVSRATVYNLVTPIGIKAFTTSNIITIPDGQIMSVTLIVHGEDVWNFPQDVVFDAESKPIFYPGVNILHMWKTNIDETDGVWRASFTARGIGARDDIKNPGVRGSCCYFDVDGTKHCDDYVTQTYCTERRGNFEGLIPCDKNSCIVGEGKEFDGVCCTEGKCVSDIGPSLCQIIGGYFISGITCGDVGFFPEDDETDNKNPNSGLCFNKCKTPTICCKNGTCLGQLTEAHCDYLGGTTVFEDDCNSAKCCDHILARGACCTQGTDGVYECTEVDTPHQCNSTSGIYMGKNTTCNPDEDICCTVADQITCYECTTDFNGSCSCAAVTVTAGSCEAVDLYTNSTCDGKCITKKCNKCNGTQCVEETTACGDSCPQGFELGPCIPNVTCQTKTCYKPCEAGQLNCEERVIDLGLANNTGTTCNELTNGEYPNDDCIDCIPPLEPEYAACFWCFPHIGTASSSEPAPAQPTPNEPGWLSRSQDTAQAPFRSVFSVTQTKADALDAAVSGIDSIVGGGVGITLPAGLDSAGYVVYRQSGELYYTESDITTFEHSILGTTVDEPLRAKTSTSTQTKFRCYYVGSYEQNVDPVQNRINCLERYGYNTTAEQNDCQLCDPVAEDTTYQPTFNPSSERTLDKIEPYQSVIKDGLHAPFPPIWGRITYNYGKFGCSNGLFKKQTTNLRLLSFIDRKSMMNSFRVGTGKLWLETFLIRYDSPNTQTSNIVLNEMLLATQCSIHPNYNLSGLIQFVPQPSAETCLDLEELNIDQLFYDPQRLGGNFFYGINFNNYRMYDCEQCQKGWVLPGPVSEDLIAVNSSANNSDLANRNYYPAATRLNILGERYFIKSGSAESNYVRGIFGRNLRYNLDSFRSSTVFYNTDGEKTMKTNTDTAIPIAYIGGYSNSEAPCNPAKGIGGGGGFCEGGGGGCPLCDCLGCADPIACRGICVEYPDAGQADSWSLQAGLIAPSTVTLATPFTVQIKKSQITTKSVYITPGICVDMLCPDCNSYESC